MVRALLAWELGGGRGHLITLATVADALRAQGVACDAAVPQPDAADPLAGRCRSVVATPPIAYRQTRPPGQSSACFGDWLGDCGYGDPDILRPLLAGWQQILSATRPDIVISDTAPAAGLVAGRLGLPVVRIGTPALTPPAQLARFPAILADRPAPIHEEARLTAVVNACLADLGAGPPLPALPALLASTATIVPSFHRLDPFAPWRDAPLVAPITGVACLPEERARAELFVYLSAQDRFDPVVVAAIGTLDLPCRVVGLGASAGVVGRRGAIVEPRPIPAAEIVRRARVLVHAGGHGLACLGLMAGLPQVLLPVHDEQVFNARALADTGVAVSLEAPRRTVPAVQAAIRRAWDDASLAAIAAREALRLAPCWRSDPSADIAARVLRALRRSD